MATTAKATKATAFRFSDDDLAALDAIQRHTGIHSRTEALRIAIRGYARAEGIDLPKSKGAKKGSK